MVNPRSRSSLSQIVDRRVTMPGKLSQSTLGGFPFTTEHSIKFITATIVRPDILGSTSTRNVDAAKTANELLTYAYALIIASVSSFNFKPLRFCSVPSLSRELLGLAAAVETEPQDLNSVRGQPNEIAIVRDTSTTVITTTNYN